MKFIGAIIGVVIAFVAIGAALHYLSIAGAQSSVVAAVAAAPLGVVNVAQTTATALPVGTGVLKDSDTVTLHGTAIMDTTSGTPAVPFISYMDAKNHLATKQLIFIDSRGCLAGAGDLPCVPSYPENSAYPQLTSGEKITVTGYIREDRFLITSMSSDS
jgi:hypothetical protein